MDCLKIIKIMDLEIRYKEQLYQYQTVTETVAKSV